MLQNSASVIINHSTAAWDDTCNLILTALSMLRITPVIIQLQVFSYLDVYGVTTLLLLKAAA